VFTFYLSAQNEFKTFTKETGLTSSNILFTYIDSKGIIWAATNHGLNAFTAGEWTPIKSISDNKSHEINLGKVLNIFETSMGELWIATEKGLFIYNRKFWTHYSDTENSDFFIKQIFEDNYGWIWVLLEKTNAIKDVGEIGFSFVEGRVQMFNGSQWFDFPGMIGGSAAVIVGEPRDYFTSIMQDHSGNIWITSLDGLYNYDRKVWTEFNDEQLPSDKCYKVIETSDNIIWVATANGIARQDGEDWLKFESAKGIKGKLTYDLFEDSQNRLWAFTRKDHKFKALCYYENNKWESCFSNDIHLKSEISKLIDFNGKTIAFSNKGISIFEKGNWNKLGNIYDIIDDNYSTIIKVNDTSIWFAAKKGLYHIINDNLVKVFSIKSKWKVTSLFESSKGEIWVGTEKDGVYVINPTKNIHFNVRNGLKDNHITEVFEDLKGSIWVVTKNGISKLENWL